LGEWLKPPVC